MGTIANVTFACDDPAAMAEFWAAAVGYEVQDAPPGLIEAIEAEGGDTNAAAAAIDPEGGGPRLFFKKLPLPAGTAAGPLDVSADDRDAEVERLEGLGATIVETKTETTGSYTETWTVMRDLEGNGFCVQSPPSG